MQVRKVNPARTQKWGMAAEPMIKTIATMIRTTAKSRIRHSSPSHEPKSSPVPPLGKKSR
jgi:hypothetical protein